MIKKFYNKTRDKLPAPLKVGLSKFIFRVVNKPIFDPTDKIELEKAIVIISADFELAWAWRYSKKSINPIEMARRERENFPLILNKLNELEIPITWATVGHLFLDSCKCVNGKPHPEIVRPYYFENEYWKFDKGDWFDIDPCGNYKSHPEFYAPDLIEMILNSKVKHEIGCHSFSHIDYSDNISSDDVIESDLQACEAAAKKFGLKLESFVFPGNFAGHFDLLDKFGYKVVRYKSNKLKEIGYPEKLTENLVAVHDSLAFDIDEEGWDYNYVLWKLKKYVQKVIENKAIAHFWFHPSIQREQIISYFIPFLEYVQTERDKGKIEVLTMKQLMLFI
ncbi:MAG: polysaccharide deacetylase family protein [Candidatus Woesearchaeota archaeon]